MIIMIVRNKYLFVTLIILLCGPGIKLVAQHVNNKTAKSVSPQKPNILWLVAEDISPYLACYGDSTAKTPNLDRLAKEGVRFTNVVAYYFARA